VVFYRQPACNNVSLIRKTFDPISKLPEQRQQVYPALASLS
jgi:hypothetical protein